MAKRLNAANNAETKLTVAVGITDTVIEVEDASGFPDVPYRLSIGDEIVEVTDASGNVLTVERARENTVATAHDVGADVENRFTAGMYEGLVESVETNETSLENHVDDGEIHVTQLEKNSWNGKQDALYVEQTRRIFIQDTAPSNPQENDIWIEV